MTKVLAGFIFLICINTFASPIERSHTIFFAPEVKKNLMAQQSFPVFWWNFIVAEGLSAEELQSLCRELNSETSHSYLERVECGVNLKSYFDIIKDWSKDVSLRQKFSFKDVNQSMNQTLAQLSISMGSVELQQVLLNDPLGAWRELKNKTEQRLKIPFPRVNGYFTDAETNRILIPVLFRYPPSDTIKTTEISNVLPANVYLVGPHRSYLENERRVTLDVETVSMVGIVILVLFALFVILTKRGVAALLIPPVLVAVSLATGLTILIFGSVHGLTLGFGSGIIGLALDYGLHGAFNKESKNTWVSNLIGLLTTLSGLMILGLSSVPLLQQMMTFSILGLIIGFTFFYVLLKVFPDKLSIKPFAIRQRPHGAKSLTILALVLISLLGILRTEPKLELKQFDFQDKKTFELATWIQSKLELKPPLMRFHEPAVDLETSHEELLWAQQNGIALENSANYLPPLAVQRENLKTWAECGAANWTKSQRELFSSVLTKDECMVTMQPNDNHTLVPRYLSHLSSGDLRLTLWLPQSDVDTAKIQERFPDSLSLLQVVSKFPEALSRELKWMIPLSVIISSLIILLYYKKVWYLVLALVPFFSGLGLVFVVMKMANIDMTFITVIGLIMVFGFSIDYGIFMTDIFRESDADHESEPAVLTALGFAALSNLIGFAPMLFAKHPVLFHLGVALFFGTLGTFIGAIWGIPGFVAWKSKYWRFKG